jgi:hypothetical protein
MKPLTRVKTLRAQYAAFDRAVQLLEIGNCIYVSHAEIRDTAPATPGIAEVIKRTGVRLSYHKHRDGMCWLGYWVWRTA